MNYSQSTSGGCTKVRHTVVYKLCFADPRRVFAHKRQRLQANADDVSAPRRTFYCFANRSAKRRPESLCGPRNDALPHVVEDAVSAAFARRNAVDQVRRSAKSVAPNSIDNESSNTATESRDV